MILGKMTKEEAIKVYRKTEEMKQRTREYIVDSIVNWDVYDEKYFHFSHAINNGLSTFYSADIDATYGDGVIEVDVYGHSDTIEAWEDDEKPETYETFLADASKYIGKTFTDVEKAEAEIKAKLEKDYNEMLTEAYLEEIFLDHYEDEYSDYDTEKGWI